MEEKMFNKIMSNMTVIIKGCQSINGEYRRQRITSTSRRKARRLQGDMDKILTNEFYHIIGMGDLTPEQTIEFNVTIKKLSKYRPVIKCVASMQEQCQLSDQDPHDSYNNITPLPAIKKSVYKSLLTGTILQGG